jgi:branched-chain amino acid transport system permease protein
MQNQRFNIGAALVSVLLIGLAFTQANEYLFFAGFVVLQFVVLASAWNILGGYAGYVNFGVPAFVALGSYSGLVVFKAFEAPLIIQIAVGALMSGLLGLLLGLLTLRLRGIFFSIATVAVVFILETLVLNWRYVGGASGMQIARPDPIFGFASYTRMLLAVMVLMAVASVAISRWLQHSRIGQGLRALRDSEEAAECSGVPTLRLKLIACTVSGAMLGAAGSPMPMYLSSIVPTSAFDLSYSVSSLAAPIIGGIGHWAGPVIGAVILGTLQQVATVTVSSELNVLVVGVLLVVFVVIAPDGILGWVKSWKRSSK